MTSTTIVRIVEPSMVKRLAIAALVLALGRAGPGAAASPALPSTPADAVRERSGPVNSKLKNIQAATDAESLPAGAEKHPLTARDPFATTERVQRESQLQADPAQFVRSDTPGASPKLKLRGLVSKAGDDAIALLEVEGNGTYMVRAGDTISLQTPGRSTVIKVRKIDKLSLMVEVGTLGQVIVVR